jgi:HK97 family phage major capsid protein
MSEGTSTAGGHLVPTPLSAQVIDLMRNRTVAIQAGAVTIPMDSQTLKLARVTGDPTAGWKVENAAATASDMTFDAVTLTAKTLMALCKLSVELAEDAINGPTTIENALAEGLAVELDRVAFMGTGVDPQPRGIWNTSGITVVASAANGHALTATNAYGKWISAIQAVEDNNFVSNATVIAPRTKAKLNSLQDTTNQPLMSPDAYKALRTFSTKQIPTNMTKGTSSNASIAIVGDFSQLLLGMRTNLVVEIMREGADASSSAVTSLQVFIRAYLRAGVQLARANHFAAIEGIIP